MREARSWTARLLLLPACLVVSGCCTFLCPIDYLGPPGGDTPQPKGVAPPPGSSDPNPTPEINYVQVKGTFYGTGGVFVQVDVVDPHAQQTDPYSDRADMSVWVGAGTPPAWPPTAARSVQSPDDYDLNVRRWGAGTSVTYDPENDTQVWVIIEVKNRHNSGGTTGDFYHQYEFLIDDIPTNWEYADKLN